VLRQRPPLVTEVTTVENVPEVWYKLQWKGYEPEDATWQRESDCHCPQLIEEYELLQQHSDEDAAVSSGQQAAPAMELSVATAIEWRLTDKKTTSRRGTPTVRCSYACVQALKSGPVCGGAVQSAVQGTGTSAVAA
jgi:hypothetical protein